MDGYEHYLLGTRGKDKLVCCCGKILGVIAMGEHLNLSPSEMNPVAAKAFSKRANWQEIQEKTSTKEYVI